MHGSAPGQGGGERFGSALYSNASVISSAQALHTEYVEFKVFSKLLADEEAKAKK